MTAGEILVVLATDPLAEMDLAILCDRLGHQLMDSSRSEGVIKIRIARA